MSCILNCGREHHGMMADLCGLVEPKTRFSHLRTPFQHFLAQGQANNPLKLATSRLLLGQSSGTAFIVQLKADSNWKMFKSLGDDKPTVQQAFVRLSCNSKETSILKDVQSRSLDSTDCVFTFYAAVAHGGRLSPCVCQAPKLAAEISHRKIHVRRQLSLPISTPSTFEQGMSTEDLDAAEACPRSFQTLHQYRLLD